MDSETGHLKLRPAVRLKKRVFDIIEVARPGDIESKIVDTFIMGLIIANLASVIVETVPEIQTRAAGFFKTFEALSVLVFSIEYGVRVWTCTCNPDYAHPVWGRIRYVVSLMALVDMAAVLPFYLPFLLPVDLRFLRAMRLFRLMRLIKMGRYYGSLSVLGRVLHSKRMELGVTIFTALIMLTITSSMMYLIENRAQPDKFTSIPAAMWWAVATLTTVGYGDYYPITPLGKILGGLVAMLGVGLFALPAGILGAGFVEEMQKFKADKNGAGDPEALPEGKRHTTIRCPHCGREVDLSAAESGPATEE